MSQLLQYLEELLQKKLKQFDLIELKILDASATRGGTLISEAAQINLANFDRACEDSSTFPLLFHNKSLGTLVAVHRAEKSSSPTTKLELEDFACQLACLLRYPNENTAVALDKFIEKLAIENSISFHWSGIYLLNKENLLELACFRGEKTPHMIIPVDSGICGAAVREKQTLNIPEVSLDSRYLSCSIKTKSEIVVPIFLNEKVIGEIDIDSHSINAFSERDEKMLTKAAEEISRLFI